MKMILEMILSKLDTWLFKKQQVLLIENDEYWLFYQNCYPKKESQNFSNFQDLSISSHSTKQIVLATGIREKPQKIQTLIRQVRDLLHFLDKE